MKMKALIVSISLLCCMAFLQSCSSEDQALPTGSKEDTLYWGYFKGDINGHDVSLENEDNKGPVRSGRSGYYFSGEWDVLPDSVNIMGTLINYNDSSELRVTLYKLVPGERYLTLSANMYWYESSIKVTVYSDPLKKTIKANYVPSEENPFRVQITDVLWLSSFEPVIEVKLNGVLYNKEDQDDTISISGAYGTR